MATGQSLEVYDFWSPEPIREHVRIGSSERASDSLGQKESGSGRKRASNAKEDWSCIWGDNSETGLGQRLGLSARGCRATRQSRDLSTALVGSSGERDTSVRPITRDWSKPRFKGRGVLPTSAITNPRTLRPIRCLISQSNEWKSRVAANPEGVVGLRSENRVRRNCRYRLIRIFYTSPYSRRTSHLSSSSVLLSLGHHPPTTCSPISVISLPQLGIIIFNLKNCKNPVLKRDYESNNHYSSTSRL